jgi:hypothetical protein
MKLHYPFIYIVFIALLLFNSCEKEIAPKPNNKSNFIVEANISSVYKSTCNIGFGNDTVVGYLNFFSYHDSNIIVNCIKVYTKNTSTPDSFFIVKGFSWLDYKIVSTPPSAINGIKIITEPNGTISLKISDVIKNDITNPKYHDSIKYRFELGNFEDVVNLKGFKSIELSKQLVFHLPTNNNIGKNSFIYEFKDSLGIDSNGMIKCEMLIHRSTPDSALNELRFFYDYPKLQSYASDGINFDENGNCQIIGDRVKQNNFLNYGYVGKVIRTGNIYKITIYRTPDAALNSYFEFRVEGYHGCSKLSNLLFQYKYKFKTP